MPEAKLTPEERARRLGDALCDGDGAHKGGAYYATDCDECLAAEIRAAQAEREAETWEAAAELVDGLVLGMLSTTAQGQVAAILRQRAAALRGE